MITVVGLWDMDGTMAVIRPSGSCGPCSPEGPWVVFQGRSLTNGIDEGVFADSNCFSVLTAADETMKR